MYTTFINASRLWLYSKGWEKLWGWDTITITGGAPLVSPIYREACELIAKEGVRITTVTNASLVF